MSLYDFSIVASQRALASLTSILKKGETAAFAAELPETRLHADMLPLAFQVHVVTDTCNKVHARLHGVEPAAFEHNMKTFDDFFARIKQTEEILAKSDKAVVESRANEIVTIGMGPGKTADLTASNYVQGYGLPNIFFHTTTAYNILRMKGIELGKQDFLAAFLSPFLSAPQ